MGSAPAKPLPQIADVTPRTFVKDDNKLYDYSALITAGEQSVHSEILEGKEFYYLALELPGVPDVESVKMTCEVTSTGLIVSVSTKKHSAVEGKALDAGKSTRVLGDVAWNATLTGVFVEGRPQCNCKDGILKMRFKKRPVAAQEVEAADF
jgi:hypothetical protein